MPIKQHPDGVIKVTAKRWFGDSIDIEIYHPDDLDKNEVIRLHSKITEAANSESFSLQQLIDFGAAVNLSEGKTIREVYEDWKQGK